MKLFDVYPLLPIEPVKGEGNYVYDKQGTKYLDFYGGHAVISIGHSHPHYIKKISEQVSQLGFYSNSIINSLQQELADKLGELSNCNDYQLFLCNSGAEANENALKVASFYNGRKKVLSFHKSFHGRTSGAVAITDNPKIIAPFNSVHQVEFFTLNDQEAVKTALATQEYTAVIIEGIQGIAGIYEPTNEFLQFLEKECKATDTVLILDEIQSGYGRSGDFFAFQSSGIQPDIISMAKGMGNGFPIGGILIAERFKPSYGMLGTTFGGSHLACAAGIAVLEVMKNENLVANAKQIGQYLIDELSTIEQVKEVRGRGLMIGVEMAEPIAPLRNKLVNEFQIFTGNSSVSTVLRILPSLTVTQQEADEFLTGFRKALQS